jgi:hypothetical protein
VDWDAGLDGAVHDVGFEERLEPAAHLGVEGGERLRGDGCGGGGGEEVRRRRGGGDAEEVRRRWGGGEEEEMRRRRRRRARGAGHWVDGSWAWWRAETGCVW